MSGYSYRGMSPIDNIKKMNSIINDTISLFTKQFNDINKAISSIQTNFNSKMQNIKMLLNQQEVITSQLVDNNSNNVNCTTSTKQTSSSKKQNKNSSSNHKHNNSQILTTTNNNNSGNKNKSNAYKKQLSILSSSSSDNITKSYYEMNALSARQIHTNANISIPKQTQKHCNIFHKTQKQQFLTENHKTHQINNTLSRNKNQISFTHQTQSQSNNPPKLLSFDLPLTITSSSPSLHKTNALLIAIHSPIMSIYDKLNIKYLCKRTYNAMTIKDICKESKDAIVNRKRQLCNDVHYNSIYNKKYPSLTAQTCLQFLSNDKQSEIINSETNKMFTELIYVVLNDGLHFNKGKYNKELYKFVFDKYKVQSIRSLFMKVIYDKVYVKRKWNKDVCMKYLKLIKGMKGEMEKGIKENKNGFGCVLLNLSEIGEYFNVYELMNNDKGICNKENEMLKLMENVIEEIYLKQKC